ncbi:MAG TPA: hypothetical protein VGV12_02355, partial [Gemmatimonadales bacterium]|nr:hypothetical protein [Gemmatimonadales bacterium]
MSRSVLKHLMSSGLVLVASLAVAVGCAKDGGTGPAADYSLSLAPAALTIVQGTTGGTTVTVTRTNFTGAVTLSLGNAPTGVTGSFDPSAPTGTSSTLTLSVGAAAAPGVYNLTVNGAGTPGNRSTPLTLTVSAAPDYALSLAPAALTVGQGANGNTTVTITRTNFTGAVTLSIGNAPTGVTGSFDPAAPTGTSSTLTVSVGAAVAPGVYNLTVNGTATPGARSTPLTLTVSAAPDYTLSLAPAAFEIAPGATGNTTVTLTRTNFTGAVTLSLGNAPTGVTGSFSPAAPTGTSSTLTVSVGAAVASGVYNLTVDGTGTAGNRSTPLTLTVSAAGDYALSLTPAELTIGQGANGNTSVTITRTNFTGAVTLSLGSAPTGVTGSFNPAAPTGTNTTLTVSVGAAVAPGVYNLTVDGTGTAGNRSTPLTLTVSAAPDYTLSLSPAALTIGQGATGNTTVTVTRTNFNGAVTLSLGNAPAGVTGSFDPAAPAGTSSTLTLSVGTAVASGVYNLTVNGSGTAGSRSTPLTLTVSATPDYSLALTPAALTVAPGATGNTTVTITRTNFTGAVTLSLGNAPTGVTGSFNPAAPTGTSSTLTVSVGAAVAPGVYNLTVDGTGTPGNRSTPLTLTVSAATAATLINGASSSGTISAPGQLDTWTFTATQGDYIALSMGTVTPASSDFAPWIRLLSPSGVLLGNSAGASVAQISVSAPASGTYTVIVGSNLGGNTNGTGSYQLTLAKGPGAFVVSPGDEGGPIDDGASNTGTIYLGDLDMWSFTATQGDYIAVSMGTVGSASAHFAPWIRLVSPTGVLVGNNATLGAAQVAVSAPTSGTYTVIVGTFDGFYDGTGSYQLTLAKGPGTVVISPGDEGGPMTNGASNAGTITMGDLDTWTFTATQGDYIALSMGTVAPASAHFAPWIRLVSPSGVLVGNNATLGAAQVAVSAPTSGTYTVIVGTFDGFYDGTGSYQLTL